MSKIITYISSKITRYNVNCITLDHVVITSFMSSFTIKLFKLIVFVDLIRIISVFISPPIIQYTTFIMCVYICGYDR